MTNVDLTQFIPLAHYMIVAVFPFLIALVAGALRQDNLPPTVNEIISYALVVAVAVVQALADGRLGGSALADFMLVAAYSQAALHSPLLQGLQQYLQSNVLTIGKPAPAQPTPAAPPAPDMAVVAQLMFDLLKKNAPQLAQLVSMELSKQFEVTPPPPAPAQPPATSGGGGYTSGSNLGVPVHVDELPTSASAPAIKRVG